MQGKFIIIEGTDGSGKATQTALLLQRLKEDGYATETIDFPRHGEPSAKLVDLYLNGFFGEAAKIDPRFISSFYAIDRLLHKEKMEKWLSEGKVVIGDRYVTSNIGHQGAKIKNLAEREKLFQWIYNLEYQEMVLPQPDLIIFLHVPTKTAVQLIEKKKKREYIVVTNKDGHEKNIDYLKAAENSYLHAAKLFKWKVIECVENGQLLIIEKINDKIWEAVSEVLVPLQQKRLHL